MKLGYIQAWNRREFFKFSSETTWDSPPSLQGKKFTKLMTDTRKRKRTENINRDAVGR